VQPPLEAAAARASRDPFFLGRALAALLGCPPDMLARLRLCRRPSAAEPNWTAEQDVLAVARHFNLDAAALAGWVEARGPAPGPLVTALDRASRGRRLSGTGLYLVIRRLGERAGLRARPHGLRHAAITAALDLTGGDVRKVQRFSRHKNLQTVLRYDDNRQDLGGDVARRLAEGA
jgi:integrase/recombinase XerC